MKTQKTYKLVGVASAITCLATPASFADFLANTTGDWDVGANWEGGSKPTDFTRISRGGYDNSIVTLDTVETLTGTGGRFIFGQGGSGGSLTIVSGGSLTTEGTTVHRNGQTSAFTLTVQDGGAINVQNADVTSDAGSILNVDGGDLDFKGYNVGGGSAGTVKMNSATATVDVSGTSSFGAHSTLSFDFNGGTTVSTWDTNNLTITSGAKLTIIANGTMGVGTYDLVTYSGTRTGAYSDPADITITGLDAELVGTIGYDSDSMFLTIVADPSSTWDGETDGNWATATNWAEDVVPVSLDKLIFTGTSNTATNNDLAASTEFNGIEFKNTADGESFSLGGNSMTLGGDIVADAAASGSITDTISLELELNGDREVLLGTGHHLELSGTISEDGSARSLTKSGSGTLTVTGSATHSGATTISTGTLQVGNGGTTGSLGSASTITTNSTLIFNRSDTVTQGVEFSGGISGTGVVQQDGTGTLILNAANTYTGWTHLYRGTTVIMDSAAVASSNRFYMRSLINGHTQTLELGADALNITTPVFVQNSPGQKTIRLDLGGTTTGELAGYLDIRRDGSGEFVMDIGTDDTLTVSGNVVTAAGGGAGITKTGAGTLVLTGSNTYKGSTVVTAGTVSIGDGTDSSGLHDSSGVSVASGAVMDLNYSGTDTVDELTLGGFGQVAGTWGATGSGAANISDTYFTGTGTLTVSVGSTTYDVWADDNGLTGPDALDTADVESDSLVNLLEFGFGTDPNVIDNAPLVPDGSVNGTPILQSSGGEDGVAFDVLFVRRDDHGTPGSATYTVQFSSDLGTFYDSSVTPTFVADSSVDSDYEVVSVPYPFILPNGKKARFFRMNVELVP